MERYNLFSFEKKTKFVEILKSLNVISLKNQHVSGLIYKVTNEYTFNMLNPIAYIICIPVTILTYLLIIVSNIVNMGKSIIDDMLKLQWRVDEYYTDKEYAKEYFAKLKNEKK